MNAYLQIGSALLIVAAGASWPLYRVMQENAGLQEQVDRSLSVEGAALSARQAMVAAAAAEGAQKGKLPPMDPERIPPGVSAAEADRTIAMLMELDAKAIPGRRIAELCERLISLPASHLEEALIVVQNSKNLAHTMMFASALFSRWGELDPEGAKDKLAGLGKGGNPMIGEVAKFSAAPGWFERDPQGFLAYIKEGQGDKSKERESGTMLRALLEMGSVSDPASQRMLIDAAPESDRPGMLISAAAKDPKSDLQGAILEGLQMANANNSEGKNSGRLRWQLQEGMRSLVERDPDKAREFMASKLNEEERKMALPAFGEALIRKDEKAGLAWVAEQTPEEQKRVFENGWNFREWDFAKADAAAAKLAPEAGAQLREQSINGLAGRNPAQAATHLSSLPENRQPDVTSTVSREWTKSDPMAASEWVQTLPEGKSRDYAINGMTGELVDREPDSAAIWAATMSDEKMRADSLNRSFPKWLKRDPEAAQTWLQESSNLPPELQDRLLNPVTVPTP